MDNETLKDLYGSGAKSGRSQGWFDATGALFDIARAATGAERDILKAAWEKLTEIRDTRLAEQEKS